MKVLHIGKFFSPFKGGVESYMRDVITALHRNGVECAALVHQHQGSSTTVEEQFGTGKGTFRLCRAGVLFTFFFTPISPAFRSLLKRLISDFQPDVIHVHLPNPSACWLLTLGGARNIPWVIHWHSDVVTSAQGIVMKLLYSAYRPLERKLLQHACAIVATSESYLRSSESLEDFPDKCHVVPLGLDPGRIRIDRESTSPVKASGEALQVLAVGRLTYYKGFGFLVRAAAEVPGIQVHIVGEGDKENELKSLAASQGLGDRVIFHGKLSDSDLVIMLEGCDCVCLPSIERTEAFGLVLLEAMCFGKATVVSDVPGSGMGWIVDNGETGIKVPPADVRGLAEALRHLAGNPEARLRMGRKGKEKFDRDFHIRQSIQPLMEIYRSVSSGL